MIKSAINQEIEWCLTHAGESGISKDYENGFVMGLRQALHFLNVIDKLKDIDYSKLPEKDVSNPKIHYITVGQYMEKK